MLDHYNIQKIINGISSDYQQAIETVAASDFVKTTYGIQELAHEIFQTATIRPKSVLHLANFVNDIHAKQSSNNKINNLVPAIIEQFKTHDEIPEDGKIYSLCKFLRALLNLNKVTVEDVKNIADSHPNGKFNNIMHNVFIPELGLKINILHPWPKRIIAEHWDPTTKEVFDNQVFYEGDQNSIEAAIKGDNEYAIDQNNNFKRQLYYTDIGEATSYLNVAAFYGSKACFMKIAEKAKNFDDNTAKFAVIGGNVDILKYLSARHVAVDKQIAKAIEYHNIDAYEYLQTLNSDFNNESTLSLELSENFLHLIQKKPNPTDIQIFHFNKSVKNGHSFAASFAAQTIPSLLTDNATLSAAVLNNMPEVVAAFMKADPKYTKRFPNNDSDLYTACVHERNEVIHTLLQFPVNVMQGCPCHVLALKGKADLVKEFFAREDFDPQVKNKDGLTILNAAIISGNDDLALWIFEKVPQLEWTDNIGHTPFHCAIANSNLTLAEFFQSKGANINTQDSTGRSPLHTACALGDIGLVSYLLGLPEIKLNLLTQHKRTPLHEAIKKGNIDVIQELCKTEGVDPNIKDDADKSPLHEAVLGGRLESVSAVIKMKNVDKALKSKGKTAFKLASTKEMRKLVLDNGGTK